MFLPFGDNIHRREIPIVTAVLIFLNALVFAREYRLVSEGVDLTNFFETWGLVPAYLRAGQMTGLLSHMFLHGGFLHIFGNMMFLWTFSCSLEASLGRSMLVAFYVLYGIAGGVAHCCCDFSSELPLVGASGAIAGLMGAYLMLFGAQSKINGVLFLFFSFHKIAVPAWVFCLGWFGLQVWHAQMDPGATAGVAWYAHIGGFMAGLVSMVFFGHLQEKHLEEDRFGEVRMVSETTERATDLYEESQEGAAATGPPVSLPCPCPHCGTSLDEEHLLGDNLLQCDGPECGRMIFVEHGIAAVAAAEEEEGKTIAT